MHSFTYRCVLPGLLRPITRLTLAGLLATITAATAAAQAPAATDSTAAGIERPDNHYAAGNRVDITSPMPADVIIAGRILTIDQPVAGDIAAAGWSIAMKGHAGDDVRLAGADVLVDGPVDGDLSVAGGDVIIGPKTIAGGRAWLTGGTVRVEGTLQRNARIAGGTVQIAGVIAQPLQIVAEKLEVLATAQLLAPVSYKGPTPAVVAAGAVLSEPIRFEKIEPAQARRARWPLGLSTILFAIHIVFAGLVFLVVLPRVAQPAADTLGTEPGRSALVGFVLLVTVPVAALVLIMSVFGLPVGLSLVALYFIALLMGIVTTAIYVGELEVRLLNAGTVDTRLRQAGALGLGVLTLTILRTVPIVGNLVVLLAALFGLGALATWIYRRSWTAMPTTAPQQG